MRKKTTTCRFDPANTNQDTPISISNTPTRHDLVSSNEKIGGKGKKRSVHKISMKSEILEGKVILDLPIKTVSEANCFEPWQKKHGRHKDQQRIVALCLHPLKDKIKLPCRLMLTRLAPNELDEFDNLPMSLKYIVDAVCAIITGEYRAGKADSDKRITIGCNQIKSKEYGVRVEIIY